MRSILILTLIIGVWGCGSAKNSGSTDANSDEQATGPSLIDSLLASAEQAKTGDNGQPGEARVPAENPNPHPGASAPPQNGSPQTPVAANVQPGQNVLEFDKPPSNPYKVTAPTAPPITRKPQLVHYQALVQTNPNVRIMDKPQAGHILTFAQDRLGSIGLKKSVDFYRASNGTYPPFNDFLQMVKLNKTEFPTIQANQMYAYCSQTGAVFVVQK
ncbi:MAG: hypothetical protein O3A00_06520 [Planctomycetota bacterium]|nr:hypothetical protein [Planctomycetota bacterium]